MRDEKGSALMRKNNGEMLEELIQQYMDEEIGLDVVMDYCEAIEPSAESKKILIECIDCYDIEILYETLFGNFEDYLSPEEAEKYRERFLTIFDLAFYLNEEIDS